MTTQRPQRNVESFLRILIAAIIGGLAALALGLLWVRLAPDNGFADLAAASITRLVLVPLGAIVGGLMGRRRVMLAEDR